MKKLDDLSYHNNNVTHIYLDPPCGQSAMVTLLQYARTVVAPFIPLFIHKLDITRLSSHAPLRY